MSTNSSIEHSLDAIEDQLSTISLNRHVSPSSNSSDSLDDDVYTDAPDEPPPDRDDVDGCDEICEMGIDGGDGVCESGSDYCRPEWVPGKRHPHEDDASVSWRNRKKHFFILSHSGKPIYSRYGDEHKLAGFSATLQAIVSFVENGQDRIQLVRAGKHQVVFLVKGPIYLVCISCTEEPYESLKGQLELIHGQMILILTKSVNRCFERNSKFDMTPLLGGTDVVFSSLIHSFSWFVL